MDSNFQEKIRALVNSLPELEASGSDPPDIEKITVDKENSKVLLYKLTTEVYVYQHIGKEEAWFGAATLQNVSILGEMSLKKARSIVQAKKIKREGG